MSKLVRDRIIEIMESKGLCPKWHPAAGNIEFAEALKDKLVEEAQEVRNALPSEIASEIADVMEVLSALMLLYAIPTGAVSDIVRAKRSARGAFDHRIILH